MSTRRFEKLDANETIWFARELESIDDTEYTELLPGALARKYIPDVPNVPDWANSHSYKMYKLQGKVKFAGPDSDDAPRASLSASEAVRLIKQLEESYSWTVREIKQAAATKKPLDRLTVLAARTAMDQKIDRLLALGDADLNIEGLLTLGDVDASQTPSSKTSGTKWATNAGNSADRPKILADLNKVTTVLFQALRQTDAPGFQKFTVLVPTDAYAAIATTPFNDFSDVTILQFALKNNPWIEAIEPWMHCDVSPDDPSKGRLVAYPRTPLCVGGVVPNPYSALAPQERNQDIIVPVSGSCGGVIARYPVAMLYMDGV